MTNSSMKVSIIIPNYNGRELLEKNFPSVLEALKNSKNYISEIVVVDDGSTDDSLQYLNQFKNEVKINKSTIKTVKHTKNRGFSATVNTGVRASTGNLIVLLNSDVSVENDFLESVIPLFGNENIFSVSLHEKGYGYSKGLFANGYIQQIPGSEVKKVMPSFYVSGGSGVFRKSIWKELGGMDEKLFTPYYWEDIDLSYRASKRGYTNLWDPNAMVVHNHRSTVSKLPQKGVNMVRERNQLLMLWKNIHSRTLIKKHVLAIVSRFLKHPGYIKVIFSALLKLPTVLKERRREIKECVVSDEAVFQKYS